MDVNSYRQWLIELEASLSNHIPTERQLRTRAIDRHRRGPGDASIADESESEHFTEPELDATILQQVQAALRRIENGTFGHCLVDGGPIEPQRLDAIPWAPYCVRHQKLLEAGSRPKPTM